MGNFHSRADDSGRHIVDIEQPEGETLYSTDPYNSREMALKSARQWFEWFNNAPIGTVESIYYILVVPATWPGPPPEAHPYSGLHVKIGRSKDVLKRIRNLQTGTSGDLILHAMEPGSPEVEQALHRKFESDRRQGEWFSCSLQLAQHMFQTWKRNRLLPPEYRWKIVQLMDRVDAYRLMREKLGGAPDMVNPSLNEKWYGKVFVDLVYTQLARGKGKDHR